MLTKLALKLNQWTSRWVPDAFIIAIILTFVVFVCALVFTDKNLNSVIFAWGGGFWSLLSFAMQMSLVMLTGFIVSEAPLTKRALSVFASLASSDRAACVLMALASMILAWVHWGLGIVGSAVLARYFAIRRPRVHYPLLVACGYFGLGALWHAGLSGSAPLLVATPGHFLEKSLGVISLKETIFSSWNLTLAISMILALSLIAWLLYPKGVADHQACPEETLRQFREELTSKKHHASAKNFAEALERSYLVNFSIGFFGLIYLGLLVVQKKWNFDLNLFNFIFFILAILLHPNIASFLEAGMNGAKTIVGVVLQFPLYAGIYGIIKDTGLSEMLAQLFVRISTVETFPLIVYSYSGILNYFVPSGGSKWAIEAPYLIEAAKSLGVSSQKLVLSYAWGDMVTDLIQPFWCLPLLAAAKIEFRQIMGYLTIAFVVSILIGTMGILFL